MPYEYWYLEYLNASVGAWRVTGSSVPSEWDLKFQLLSPLWFWLCAPFSRLFRWPVFILGPYGIGLWWEGAEKIRHKAPTSLALFTRVVESFLKDKLLVQTLGAPWRNEQRRNALTLRDMCTWSRRRDVRSAQQAQNLHLNCPTALLTASNIPPGRPYGP
jgi:hypothetical protein